MRKRVLSLAAGLVAFATGAATQSDPDAFARLPAAQLDVTAPSARVSGEPGRLQLNGGPCRDGVPESQLRRRIVDVAVQEWGWFGFPLLDQVDWDGFGRAPVQAGNGWGQRGFDAFGATGRTRADELRRTASDVAGYWSVTAEGAWIVERQNTAWRSNGHVTRWRDPWSAAFISWVMCEAGLATTDRFRRAIAHHAYIDQAIRARDGQAPDAAFVARDIGERPVAAGDMLCASRRPAYATINDRRRQMGSGARTHCDIVVAVDGVRERIVTVGGNVRGTVGLKLLPAVRGDDGALRPLSQARGEGPRPMFAHLQLRADPIEDDALASSPTMRALACRHGVAPPAQLVATGLAAPGPLHDGCVAQDDAVAGM